MAITKFHNSSYLLSFRPDGVRGKQIRKKFKTKREALAYQKSVLSGKNVAFDKRTLNDLILIWYDYHGRSLKSSEDTKNRLLKLSDAMGNPLASLVDGSLFSVYRQSRVDSGISPATVNRELSTLKGVYSELFRLGYWSAESPILKVRKFKEQKRELSYLTIEEINLLFLEINKSFNDSLYPVVSLCLATGARWSEAEKITFSNLTNQGVNYVDTKNGYSRFVPVTERVFLVLSLFLTANGSFSSCYSAFRSALSRSGIKTEQGQSAHVLRHTFASHFIMNGGNVLTLQKILGHSSLQMTMRYAHLSPDYLQDAVKFNPLSMLGVSNK